MCNTLFNLNSSTFVLEYHTNPQKVKEYLNQYFIILFSEIKINTDSDNPTGNKSPRKPSPLTMDLLSIIWYLTTLVALIGFFIVMACTENGCGRNRSKPDESRITRPPTPAPSCELYRFIIF